VHPLVAASLVNNLSRDRVAAKTGRATKTPNASALRRVLSRRTS
jgi:hypothetical protein